MENQKYTMEDIAQFLIDYEKCNKCDSIEWLIYIPFIGRKFMDEVILENAKITNFKNAYNSAINGSIEQQKKFISEMTPILDDFYANKEKKKTGRR